MPPLLPGALESHFIVETVEPDQVSGTLLISAPTAIVTPWVHVSAVARAIRGAASSLNMPCIALTSPESVERLKSGAPSEVTLVLAENVAPSAIAARLEAIIQQSSSRKDRPRTLVGFGSSAPSVNTVDQAIARTKEKPSPPSPQPKEEPTRVERPRSHSPVVPEDKWIRPSQHPTPRPPPASARKKRSPSPVAPPAVGKPAAEILSLRVALVDDDVTRADAIAASLRAIGHVVFLVAATEKHVHWPLLRRFSPQVIVIQPDVLSVDDGIWKTTVARDPFVRQTPLIPVVYSEVFDEKSGRVDPSPLLPRFEGIGRAEIEFATRVGSGKPLEVDRAQINPGRLLALLSEVGRSVTITCATPGETMTWNIAGAMAGRASIGSDVSTPNLTPPQALDRLLQRPQAQIVVQARSDVSVASGQDVFELLDEAYESYLPSPRIPLNPHDPTGSDPHGNLPTQPRGEPPPSPTSDLTTDTTRVHVSAVLPPGARSGDSEPPTMKVDVSQFVPSEASVRSDSEPPTTEVIAADLLPAPSGETSDDPTIIRSALVHPGRPLAPGANHPSAAPVEADARRKRLVFAALAGGGLLLAAGGIAVMAAAEDESEAPRAATEGPAAADTSGSPDPQKQSTKSAHSEPPASEPPEADENAATPDGEASLWQVSGGVPGQPCEEILGKEPRDYAGKARWRSTLAWENARKMLVAGRKDAAKKFMCEAAFMQPTGPATPGLATLYLSERALEQARRWAETAVQKRPEPRYKSNEVLGDVLNQMGQQQRALALWLETLQLDEGDSKRRASVSSTLVRSSKLARKGGDSARAERLLRRAAALDPKSAEAAGALSQVLVVNKQSELAQRWAQHALALDEDQPAAHFALGELAVSADDEEAARQHFQRIGKKSEYFRRAKERLRKL